MKRSSVNFRIPCFSGRLQMEILQIKHVMFKTWDLFRNFEAVLTSYLFSSNIYVKGFIQCLYSTIKLSEMTNRLDALLYDHVTYCHVFNLQIRKWPEKHSTSILNASESRDHTWPYSCFSWIAAVSARLHFLWPSSLDYTISILYRIFGSSTRPSSI